MVEFYSWYTVHFIHILMIHGLFQCHEDLQFLLVAWIPSYWNHVMIAWKSVLSAFQKISSSSDKWASRKAKQVELGCSVWERTGFKLGAAPPREFWITADFSSSVVLAQILREMVGIYKGWSLLTAATIGKESPEGAFLHTLLEIWALNLF